MEELFILGIGRNTVTIMDLVEDCGYKIKGLLHYNNERNGEEYFGHTILDSFEDFIENNIDGTKFALSMGNLAIRKDIYNRITSKGGEIPTLIHPSCIVSKRSKIGEGVQIMPGSIIQGDSSIGNNTVITVNTVVAHGVEIGSHCLISGNVMVGAYSSVGNMTHIGQGSTIVSGKVRRIGNNCILGAGATLLTDMPDRTIFVGAPAHFIKNVSI